MYEAEIEDLRRTFGEITTVERGETHLVRLPAVPLPSGCKPERTQVLLTLHSQDRPLIYVQPGIIGPHGGPPRSCSDVLVEGESWMQFSYQFQWSWADGLVTFVGTALRRFAKHE